MMKWKARLFRLAPGLIFLLCVSASVGLLLNQLRTSPLPLIYLTPEQRLTEILHRIHGTLIDNSLSSTALPEINLSDMHDFVLHQRGLVIDARQSTDWENGHLPGAINLSSNNFEKDYLNRRNLLENQRGRPLVVYCTSRICSSSQRIGLILTLLGHRDVRIFSVGWDAWLENHYPVAFPLPTP
jgi:rhodanese-related sulfurtransferase